MKIEKGLFNLDNMDHHAILGVSVDADAKQIRKRYLAIARRLHPDSVSDATTEERDQASDLLSKFVNPAYEKLSQEKEAAEYRLVLRLKGQQARKENFEQRLESDPAREVMAAAAAEHIYLRHLNALANKQFEDLSTTWDIIGQISELNLAYLMRKAGEDQSTAQRGVSSVTPSAGSSPAAATGTPAGTAPSQTATSPSPAVSRRVEVLASYLNRAQEFEAKQDYQRAILELREAAKAFPRHARCHSLLGMIYLKTNQATMARIHIDKALELDPNDKLAQQGKQLLAKKAVGKSQQSDTSKKVKTSDKPKGGLFGLFGGKKQ